MVATLPEGLHSQQTSSFLGELQFVDGALSCSLCVMYELVSMGEPTDVLSASIYWQFTKLKNLKCIHEFNFIPTPCNWKREYFICDLKNALI